MALSGCCASIDKSGRELVSHGTTAFPVACYQDDQCKMHAPWHWHQEWEAVRIIQGSCIVTAGSKKGILHEGEGFFINSGIIHSCMDVPDVGCRFHSVVFYPGLVGGAPESVFQQTYVQPLLDNPGLDFLVFRPDIPWQRLALDAIETAWQQCVQEPEGYVFAVRGALSALTVQLWRNVTALPGPSGGKAARNAERIKAMLRFIHANYGSELSTHAIAASVSISESECLRCFRSTIHTTPIQYLKQYRITQAAKQLLETNDRVSDIASRCGFQDMSYFTRAFRVQIGCVPSQYRKAANP